MLMSPIQKNRVPSPIENDRGARQSSSICLETVRFCCGSDGERYSLVAEPICTKRLYERKNLSMAYVTQQNRWVVLLLTPEKKFPVVIIGNI